VEKGHEKRNEIWWRKLRHEKRKEICWKEIAVAAVPGATVVGWWEMSQRRRQKAGWLMYCVSAQVYRGVGDAARGIVREQGIQGLYRGLGVTLVEIIPYAALQFGLYDTFKTAYQKARRRAGLAKVRYVAYLTCSYITYSEYVDYLTINILHGSVQ
jgi:hypothetical protein